ncbi:MAG TPA: SRPBCC family protein [Baekduia sp.]|nr:SRPBCC family protein [Baekduia sp.]
MKIDLELATTIRRPAGDVFAFLADPRNLPAWDRRVETAEVLGGDDLRVGSRVREVRKAGPRRVEQLVEVDRLDPPRRLSLRVLEGPVAIHADFRVQPHGGGSRVVLRAHGTPSGPQLLAPLLRFGTRRVLGGHLERLTQVLEAEV